VLKTCSKKEIDVYRGQFFAIATWLKRVVLDSRDRCFICNL